MLFGLFISVIVIHETCLGNSKVYFGDQPSGYAGVRDMLSRLVIICYYHT